VGGIFEAMYAFTAASPFNFKTKMAPGGGSAGAILLRREANNKKGEKCLVK
jgi:hypothetical protein